jgi:rhamnogalacturonyl hydrolase YesR
VSALQGSVELLADRHPADARKLLDPVLEHMMEAVHRYQRRTLSLWHLASWGQHPILASGVKVTAAQR